MTSRAVLAALVLGVAAAGALRAERAAQDAAAQAQIAHQLFADGNYGPARDGYRRVRTDDPAIAIGAGAGLVLALLRTGEFESAHQAASGLMRAHPSSPIAASTWGDALFSMGRFEESEAAYARALDRDPDQPRARHGRARSLAGQGRLEDALAEVQRAIRSAPRDLEFHHTLGAIYERLRRFEDAAAALTDYVALLPNHQRSEKAAWARASC